jgi:hypothetical protein
MADRLKGIVIEIGAETQGLDKALKTVNSTSRDLQKELRDVERLLKFNPDSAELLAQKQKLLNDQVENTTQKLNQLKAAEAQVQAQFERGDIGADQYRAFQREIVATEGQLRGLERRIDSVDDSNAPKNVADDIRGIDKAASRATDSIKTMGGSMNSAMKGIAGAAAAGAGAIGGLIVGTQELNLDLAKLRTNAMNQGFNVEGVEEGFRKIAAVSGETDAAVETLSNLMATGFTDQQLSEVIDQVNGAAIRFSDTLKSEGIADGIQETFATGAAVGPFAELLERSGVNLDTFNAGLASAAAQGKETDFVLQTMADLGLASANEEFQKLNPEVMAQQEAQIGLQMALAELGVALTPLATLVTNFLTKVAEWSLANITLVQSFDSIAAGIVALLPTLFGSGLQLVTTIVQAIIDNLPLILNSGTQILLQLITGIISMLPSLFSQIQSLIPLITSILQQNLPLIISAGINLILSLLTGIVNMLPQILSMALKIIVLIATELFKHLPKIMNTGIELIFALIDGIVSMLPEIVNTILFDIIPAIINTFQDVELERTGELIIQGLINGISNMAKNVYKMAQNIADGITKRISKALKLGSPSKVTMEMGEFTGEGLAIGMKNTMGQISSMASQMANFAVPDIPKNNQLQMSGAAAGAGRTVTVNLHSPKALDVREANRAFNRTLNRMSLMW